MAFFCFGVIAGNSVQVGTCNFPPVKVGDETVIIVHPEY